MKNGIEKRKIIFDYFLIFNYHSTFCILNS